MSIQQRYVIVGAGAIGGTIGGRLAESGRDVVLVARGAHLAALRAHGLRLDEHDRSRTLSVPAVGAVGEVDWRPGDVALLCTKSQDTGAVLAELPRDVVVVCAQNSVANERAAVAAGFGRVYAMCVVLPADHVEPGVVVCFGSPRPGLLDVGCYPDGLDEHAKGIAADLAAAGFAAAADPDVMRWKYRKLLVNLGNAAEAACASDDPDLGTLFRAAMDEGQRCLDAAGIAVVSRDEEREHRGDLVEIASVAGHDRVGSSTRQSLHRGTGSVESAYLNGEIVELGRRHGVATPVNAVLLDTMREMAAAGEVPGSRRAADLLAAASSPHPS